MNLSDILSYLPTIATALVNPVAGVAQLAAKFLGPKVGLDAGATVEAVTQKLEGLSPEEIVKMKQLDTDLQAHLSDNGIKLAELESKLNESELKDVDSARQRDIELSKATGGRPNYTAVSMYVLAVTVVAVLAYEVIINPTLHEYAKGIITLVLGRFLGYLDSIYQFEFGTTRTSRTKDDTIKALSNNGNGNGH